MKKDELEKIKHNKNTTTCKQSETKNQREKNIGKITKHRQKPKAPSR